MVQTQRKPESVTQPDIIVFILELELCYHLTVHLSLSNLMFLFLIIIKIDIHLVFLTPLFLEQI
jgi:hypothetical protein